MIDRLRLPSLLVWLTALWVALWGDLTLGNVAAGLIVAVGVVAVARPVGVNGLEGTTFRPVAALRFFAYFLFQLVKSNLVVAWEIVSPELRDRRAVVHLPMHASSAGVVMLVANSITLTPGTVTVDVIEDGRDDAATTDAAVQRTLAVHVLHAEDVETVRRDVLRLERHAIRAFGRHDDLAAVDEALIELEEAAS